MEREGNVVRIGSGEGDEDGFIGIREAAAILGVSLATIRRMTARNDIRCYRFSRMGHRRFRRSDIENFIERRIA